MFNRKTFAAFAAVALMVMGLAPSVIRADSALDFTLVNDTGYTIDKVFVSPTKLEQWGEDVMGLQAVYTEFTQYCLQHPAEVQKAVATKSLEEFVAATRILRGILDAPKADRQVYLAKVSDLSTKYDAVLAQTTTTASTALR